jgi:coenzyme F420 biosynthesis associated uncharacterized protein
VSEAGPARARVVDRPAWVSANVRSFRRLLSPITDKLGEQLAGSRTAGSISRVATGAELGVLLGWMSTRVLGQYDMLLVEDPDDPGVAAEQDVVYYVGPNVLALERRFGFPPREFRLWLALHEVTHRAQFTGVPWLRPHYLGLIDGALGSVDPDPNRLLVALRHVLDERRAGRNPLEDGGLVGVLATAEQRAVLDQVGGMMSLLEGHGDVTMDRAGAGRVPSADRFSRVLRARRQTRPGPAKVLQRLLGLEAKFKQYEAGERFIAAVEAEGGPGLVARAWERPEHLPTLAEIKAPAAWLARVGGVPSADQGTAPEGP